MGTSIYFFLVPIIIKETSARESWKWDDSPSPTKNMHVEAQNILYALFLRVSSTSLTDELLWCSTLILLDICM